MVPFCLFARCALFFACALPASAEDARTGTVQRKWTDFLLVALPVLAGIGGGSGAVAASAAGAAGAVFLFASASKAVGDKGFGAADLRMAAAIGALGGYRLCMYASAAAVLLSLPYAVSARGTKKQRSFPFVPQLTAGTVWSLCVVHFFPHIFRAETLLTAISFAG